MNTFTIVYNTNKRGLPTLFKYQYFTIDAEQRKSWDYTQLNNYMGEYKLTVSNSVLNKFLDNQLLSDVLKDLEASESIFIVSKNNGNVYQGNKQYIRCRIPIYVLKSFKKIFISTLVYASEGLETPYPEYITFSFDPNKKTVEIIDINLFVPDDNPYYKYARNAVDSLSVEAIGLSQYNIEAEKSVKDFYDRNLMTQWKERAKLQSESEIADKAGVYMLYDENNNTFYVGKGIRLKERIIQHTKDVNDPIPNFTHYRYSVISPEYYEFLYLIENAAIHDFAWLLDMPAAKKYTPALVKKVKSTDLNSCRMVNTAEHQTRKQ